MQSTEDCVLLRQYAENHSEEAFAALVTRYLNLVYSVAFRHVRDPQGAEDIAQAVFILLGKKAGQLRHGKALSSWLFQTTRWTAKNFRRAGLRRHRREHEAHMRAILNDSQSDIWPSIAPLLDDAVAALRETERRAILLRFYEGRDLREIAATLGVSEDAAEKRVRRGVEKLRKFFTNNGVNAGASAVVVVISTHAVQAAPAGLWQSISTAVALGGTSITATAIASSTKAITMTATQKTMIVAGFLAAVGTGTYEARRASILQSQLQTLQQDQAPLVEQIQQLQQANSDMAFELASMRGEKDRLELDSAELIQSRAEISRLRSAAMGSANSKAESPENSTEATVRTWLARASRLKEHMREKPDAWIPEGQFLDDKDWLDASHSPLDSEDGLRRASSSLRQKAKNKFARMTLSAVKSFSQASDGQFPTSVDQLKPFFTVPVDDSMLDRYEIVPLKALPIGSSLSGKWAVAEKAPTDAAYDSRGVIGAKGFLFTSFRTFPIDKKLWWPYDAFLAANPGVNPTEPVQLLPYATTQEQRTAIQQAVEVFSRQNQNGP